MQIPKPKNIDQIIFIIRGQRVIFDSDLAALYEVETKSLNRAVSRNIERFPADFMFRLTNEEFKILRYQIGTLRSEHGKHRKYLPLVFTEQGIAMLSSILKSKKAAQVNISIMRTFVKMRQLLLEESLTGRFENLEKGTDKLFKIVFQRLDELEINLPILPEKRRKVGIHQD